MNEAEAFIKDTVDQVRPLQKAYLLADWEAAVSGTPEAIGRSEAAQAARMTFYADPARFATARRLHDAGAADPLIARQIKLITLNAAQNQQDAATIQRLAQVEAEVRSRYYNFRGTAGGRQLNDNELDDLLSQSRDSRQVQDAWEASKQVGAQVADQVRELARVRNAAARRQGYRDHFQRALTLNEIDEAWLLDMFARLEAATDAPFGALKAEIDAARARRFGLPVTALRPWHYGNRFFQDPPAMDVPDLDGIFAGKDPVQLALATYDGLGLDVRDILARSDLYPREGKNQHAFSIDIDREGDVRTLNNLQPNHRWTETLLHELGHAVYSRHHDPALPWLLRDCPHTTSTEAVALLMGSLTYDREWLEQVAGLPAADAANIAAAARGRERAMRLVFARWCLVMTHFERRLYAEPDADLNALWWDLVEKYQRLRRPEGRNTPDWAGLFHFPLTKEQNDLTQE
jgi:peptidyl-dipeptidase A